DGVAAALAAGGRSQTPVLSADPTLESWEAMRVTKTLKTPDLDALSMGSFCFSGGGASVVAAPLSLTPGGGPSIESGEVVAAVADVAILAEPKKLVRLEVTPPKGKMAVSGSPYKNRAGEPGKWKVKASAAGYEDYEATFHALVDDVTVHRIELKELGGLEVSGTPAGATVKVTGPDKFSHAGALTWKASGLKSGTYQVKVSRKGYHDYEKSVEVRTGQRARLPVELEKTVAVIAGTHPTTSVTAGLEWVYSKPAGLSFARSETTVAQYRACVEAGNCEANYHGTKSEHKYCNWGYSDRDDHPMNCVGWFGAEQFCEWVGGRLPTEQEWEAEAGAGGRREYPWGGETPSCSLCVMDDSSTMGSAGSDTDGCGGDRTWPVCSKRQGDSVSGLCDMAGNIWEWTSSWYDSDGESHVVRGGSYYLDGSESFSASHRYGLNPRNRFGDAGFRCVVLSR
ncbi:MAG: SUMF1/EgtB/PvdO family nonheme iron enzyme, partial [Candidatus Eisenbacteria bacterium]